MNSKPLFFIFLILALTLFCNSASAGVSYTAIYNRYSVDYGATDVDLPTLETAIGNSSRLTHDGTVWYLNTSLKTVSSGYVLINDSFCTKLYINNSIYTEGLSGKFKIHGVDIESTSNDDLDLLYSTLYSCDITGTRNNAFRDSTAVGEIHDLNFYNVGYGLSFSNVVLSSPISIYNIYLNGATNYGSAVVDSTNMSFSNVEYHDIADYTNPIDNQLGFYFDNSSNCSLSNFYINGTGWSGADWTNGATHILIEDGTVINSGHNGLDLHGGSYNTARNITSIDSVSNGLQVSYVSDSTVDGIYTSSSTGRGAQINGYDNITIYNFTSTNESGTAIFANNVTIINPVLANVGGWVLQQDADIPHDTTIIDAVHNGITTEHDVEVYYSENTNLINFPSNDFYFARSTSGEIYSSWYPNIIVVDQYNNPISGAVVTFLNNDDLVSMNGYGDEQESFITDVNGKLYDSGNRSNWAALVSRYANQTITETYDWNVSAVYQGQSNNTVTMSLDINSYSDTVSDLQGTLYTITLSPSETGGSTTTELLNLTFESDDGNPINEGTGTSEIISGAWYTTYNQSTWTFDEQTSGIINLSYSLKVDLSSTGRRYNVKLSNESSTQASFSYEGGYWHTYFESAWTDDVYTPAGTEYDYLISVDIDNNNVSLYRGGIYRTSYTIDINSIDRIVVGSTSESWYNSGTIDDILVTSSTVSSTPLAISDYSPSDTTPSSVNGTGQTFTVTLTQPANVVWMVGGIPYQTNTSVTSASYTNTTAPAGIYNVTASATDGSTNVTQTWTWTVTEVPVIPTDTITWDNILSRAQSDTENAISLGAILPVVIISGIIISLIIGMAYNVIEFEAGVKAILVMLVVSLILMIALPIFNSLYS